MTYTGECIGGPWHGEKYAHEHKSFRLVKPMMEFSMSKPVDHCRVEAVTIGRYYWDADRKIWYWSGYDAE